MISGPLRKVAEPRIVEWLDTQPLETLHLAAISVAALRFGVASLPVGKRRSTSHDALQTRVLSLFAGRILSFDLAATQAYSKLMGEARRNGLAISSADGYVAATAVANGMMVATRDPAPFIAAGVSVINPWEA